MKFEIRPGAGIGRMNFGIDRDQVRLLMSSNFRSQKPTPTTPFPKDYFPAQGLFADYDMAGRLAAIELTAPAEAILDGVDLLKMNFTQARFFFEKRDSQCILEPDSVISKKLGLAIWAPNGDEDDLIETVLGFRDRYYEDFTSQPLAT